MAFSIVLKSFYEQLYTSHAASSDDIDAYFKSLPLENELDNESQLKCEGPVTYKECEIALSKMKKKNLHFWMVLQQNFIKCFGLLWVMF